MALNDDCTARFNDKKEQCLSSPCLLTHLPLHQNRRLRSWQTSGETLTQRKCTLQDVVSGTVKSHHLSFCNEAIAHGTTRIRCQSISTCCRGALSGLGLGYLTKCELWKYKLIKNALLISTTCRVSWWRWSECSPSPHMENKAAYGIRPHPQPWTSSCSWSIWTDQEGGGVCTGQGQPCYSGKQGNLTTCCCRRQHHPFRYCHWMK